MKKAEVKVAVNPNTGAVITPSKNNPAYGTIMLKSEMATFENGFIQNVVRVAFLRADMETLRALDFSEGQVIPGQIIVKESHEPFYENQDCKRYPESHPSKAGQEFLLDGKKVYRESTFTQDLKASSYEFVNSTIEVNTAVHTEQESANL